MSYTLQQHLAYNVWANRKIADFLESAGENIFHSEVISSFPSVQKTVLHIWDAEYIWLKRLQGESLTTFPGKNFTGTMLQCLQGWLQCSQQFADYIASQNEQYYSSVCHYENMKGDAFSNTVEGIVMHVVNHGAFHRGQVITLLRQQGYTQLNSTDLITFLRM